MYPLCSLASILPREISAAAGLQAAEILRVLDQFSKYDVSPNVRTDSVEQVSRYGRIRLTRQRSAGERSGYLPDSLAREVFSTI